MDLVHSSVFASHVEGLMQAHHVPGLAMAVLQNDSVASAGYGWASLDPPRPCTADTLFNIASASKSMTAASVALLVHDNARYPQVQYEATMSSLLPDDFVMSRDEYTKGVTVDDVLGHRTGIAGHDLSYMGIYAARPDDARSVTRNLRNLDVAYPIRSKHVYCNMMYTVASYLVEKMTSLPFADFLDSYFFRPLNMTSTNLQPGRARAKGLADRIATGYWWDREARRYQDIVTLDDPEAQGADAIVTSANDYIKWVKALLNHEGPITRDVYEGLVKPRAIEEPDNGYLPPFTSPLLYTAGLEEYNYRGHKVISHDGSNPGLNTYHFFVPDFGAGGVVFVNSDTGSDVVKILMREIIDEFLQVPSHDRVDWARLAERPAKAKRGGRNDVKTIHSTQDADYESNKPLTTYKHQYDGSKVLAPGRARPQRLPLSAYTGTYWNKGYHGLTVEIKDGRLFIDGTDRSMPFIITSKYQISDNQFIAELQERPHGTQGIGDKDEIDAIFQLHNGTAVKMGLRLEYELPGLIWMDKV